MKRILFLCLIIPLFKCKNSAKDVMHIQELKTKSLFERLLKKYENVTFDTLKVYSSDKLEDDSYPFKGKQLDSASIKLFPKEISGAYEYDSGYYACLKFRIDSSRIGLITRTPSDYEPSSIKLLIFDEKVDSIVQYMELAETIGDAGESLDKSSYLFKDEKKAIQCFIWQQNSHDNSVDNLKDTTTSRSNYYYLVTLQKPGIDTLSTDSAKLCKRFYGLVKE